MSCQSVFGIKAKYAFKGDWPSLAGYVYYGRQGRRDLATCPKSFDRLLNDMYGVLVRRELAPAVAIRTALVEIEQMDIEKRQFMRAAFLKHADLERYVSTRDLPKATRKPSGKRKQASREDTKGFYQSWEWKQLRLEVLMEQGRRCGCCGTSPENNPHARLVVDHIEPISKRPDLRLHKPNLQVLCNDCNMGKSNRIVADFRPCDEPDERPLTAIEEQLGERMPDWAFETEGGEQ